MKKITKVLAGILLSMLAVCSSTGILAATAVPSKETKTPSSVIYSADSSASPRSTSKAASATPTAATEDDTEVLVVNNSSTTEPIVNLTAQNQQMNRYLTKGGAFGWFLLTVLVSAVVSFLISYRFYKMGRKENHLAAEIRALKKDIDLKMQGTIGMVSEYQTRISNSNPSYSMPESEIKTTLEESDDEQTREIYKKWETQLLAAQHRAEAEHARSTVSQRRPSSARYREKEHDDESASVRNRVKEVLGDMFPFNK